MKQAIATGLINLGFTQLGMATGNAPSAIAMANIGEDVTNVLRDTWQQKEAMDVQNREGQWFAQTMQAAQQQYSYSTTPIPGPDGELAIPSGPPGPDGQPTGTVPIADPRAIKLYQTANVKMAKTVMDTTMQFYGMMQRFKNNPYVSEMMRGIMTAQQDFLSAIANPAGEQAYDRAIGREQAIESHETDIDAKRAQAEYHRAMAGRARREGEADVSMYPAEIMKKYQKQFSYIYEKSGNEVMKLVVADMVNKGVAKSPKDARMRIQNSLAMYEKGEPIPDEDLAYVTQYRDAREILSMNTALKDLKGLSEEQIAGHPALRMYSLNQMQQIAEGAQQNEEEAAAQAQQERGLQETRQEIELLQGELYREDLSDEERAGIEKLLGVLSEEYSGTIKGGIKSTLLKPVHSVVKKIREVKDIDRKKVDKMIELGVTMVREEEKEKQQQQTAGNRPTIRR